MYVYLPVRALPVAMNSDVRLLPVCNVFWSWAGLLSLAIQKDSPIPPVSNYLENISVSARICYKHAHRCAIMSVWALQNLYSRFEHRLLGPRRLLTGHCAKRIQRQGSCENCRWRSGKNQFSQNSQAYVGPFYLINLRSKVIVIFVKWSRTLWWQWSLKYWTTSQGR